MDLLVNGNRVGIVVPPYKSEKKVLRIEFEVFVVLLTELRDRVKMMLVEMNQESSGRCPVPRGKLGLFLVGGGEADQNEN